MEAEIRALLEELREIVREEESLFTLPDVLLRVPWSRPTVLKMIRERRIPMVKVEGKWIISRKAFRRAVDKGFEAPKGIRVSTGRRP